MKKHFAGFVVFLLIVSTQAFSQEKVEISSMFLENKNLGPVNFETKAFSKWGEKLGELLKDELKKGDEPFELVVVTNFSPYANGDFTVHTKPEISNSSVILQALKAKIARIKQPEALFTSATVVTLAKVNGGLNTDEVDYHPKLIFPSEKRRNHFKQLSLENQLNAIQIYALNEIIPLLAEVSSRVDNQFAGVRSLGTDLEFIEGNSLSKKEVKDLTDYSSTYWRALIEMEAGDQLVGTIKVAMHSAAGDLDIANRYLSALQFFATPQSLPAYLLEEFNWRLELFYAKLEQEVEQAILLESKDQYDAALLKINTLLKLFPHSAWLNYEKYYTLNNLQIDEGESASDFGLWDSLSAPVFNSDPLYPAEVAVRSGDEAYELYLRKNIGELFKDKNRLIKDMVVYADHSLDLKAYAFAAHLYWNLVNTKSNASSGRNLTHEFLYCLLRLGDKYTVQKFNPEVIQAAQEVAKERHRIKIQNDYYKTFKK